MPTAPEGNQDNAVQVVAGVIKCADRILIARRAPGKHLAGYWEFPGGKIEAEESMEQSLIREIFEEFSIKITVGKYIGSRVFRYPDRTIQLHAVQAYAQSQCDPGDSHDDVAWVTAADLDKYELAPADAFIVEHLLTAT